FLAGHETTAIALSWTFYLLAQHPEVEERLVSELREVLGDAPPTVAHMQGLRYTEMIVKESMRLYPPAWRVGRETVRACRIGEYEIPAGAQVIMSQWVVHRDPRFFDDPEQFDPSRWEPGRSAPLPKYAYFPFAGGARRCIGDSFAMMEAVLILASVMQRYHLTLVPGQKITLWPSITLRPVPAINMIASRR
ncbi:MAG TPA: cytochrome P450, partial [Anseongella sp.]|nr:cytochrome P450 [Anseongella sp.]